MRYLIFCSLFFIVALNSFSQGKKNVLNGIATYYHDRFEGRKTANGEIFSQKQFTCAHKTLPINTFLKVTNLKNDKIIVLRVNDRLPPESGVLLDLTYTAAKELDFIWKGSTTIRAEIIDTSNVNESIFPLFAEASKGMKIRKNKIDKNIQNIISLTRKDSGLIAEKTNTEFLKIQNVSVKDTVCTNVVIELSKFNYGIQVLSYNSQDRAKRTADQLMKQYKESVSVKAKEINGKMFYRVVIGQYSQKSDLVALKSKLEKDYKGCYALALD